MNDIVNLVFRDDFIVSLKVGDIQLLIAARKVHLLITDISSYHIIFADNIAKSIDEGDTNLTLASGNKYLSSMLFEINESLSSDLPRHVRSNADRKGVLL